MTEFTFTDADLRLAAEKVRTAMLASLPEPDACSHEFSPSFLEKMDALIRQANQRQLQRWTLHRIAAVFLALFIGVSVFVALHGPTRAVVMQWVREVYENSIVYRFFNGSMEESVPRYVLSWVPDGFSLTESYSDKTEQSAFYQNSDGTSAVVFECVAANDDILVEFITDANKSPQQSVWVNGCQADFYPSDEQSNTNNLIWMDETLHMVFVLSSDLELSELVQIAENIIIEE